MVRAVTKSASTTKFHHPSAVYENPNSIKQSDGKPVVMNIHISKMVRKLKTFITITD